MNETRAAAGPYLQRMLHEEIPLTRHLGIEVETYSGEALTLRAPLGPNTNHKSTAFGGSLYSIAVLAGWGLIFLRLREEGLSGHIVIHKSQADYRHPVVQDITASCQLGPQQHWERFLGRYRRKGLARLHLAPVVRTSEGVAFELQGTYVVHR